MVGILIPPSSIYRTQREYFYPRVIGSILGAVTIKSILDFEFNGYLSLCAWEISRQSLAKILANFACVTESRLNGPTAEIRKC